MVPRSPVPVHPATLSVVLCGPLWSLWWPSAYLVGGPLWFLWWPCLPTLSVVLCGPLWWSSVVLCGGPPPTLSVVLCSGPLWWSSAYLIGGPLWSYVVLYSGPLPTLSVVLCVSGPKRSFSWRQQARWYSSRHLERHCTLMKPAKSTSL